MCKITGILLSFLLVCGCAMTVESRLDSVRDGFMTTEVQDNEYKKQNNLDLLLTADALFHNNDYSNADAAYEEFNRRNIDTTSGSFSREAISFIIGPSVNDYKPYMMDSLFVSYYQLWTALATGRYNDARVIINQSYARQQDMSIAYKKTLEENQKALQGNEELASKLDTGNSVWTAYRDIMNPALMYLSGIYFLTSGDFVDAQTYLDRAAGMEAANPFIKQDAELAKKHEVPTNTIWVFVEDGFAPKLHETRITLPIFTSNGTSFATIALSEPIFMNNFTSIDGAKNLADIDAMFMTEYKEYRANDALRAMSSMAGRLALQTSMYNSHSSAAPLLGFASSLFSLTTSGAEVRTWATLPKTISVLRMKNDKTGLIELRSGGNLVSSISVPKRNGNYLVYVRFGPKGQDTKVIKLK